MELRNVPPGFEHEALRMWLLLLGKNYLCLSSGDGGTSSQRALMASSVDLTGISLIVGPCCHAFIGQQLR